jgi:hypothetical protein
MPSRDQHPIPERLDQNQDFRRDLRGTEEMPARERDPRRRASLLGMILGWWAAIGTRVAT